MFKRTLLVGVLFGLLFGAMLSAGHAADIADKTQGSANLQAEGDVNGVVTGLFDDSASDGYKGVIVEFIDTDMDTMTITIETVYVAVTAGDSECLNPEPANVYAGLQLYDYIEAWGLRSNEYLLLCPQANYYLRNQAPSQYITGTVVDFFDESPMDGPHGVTVQTASEQILVAVSSGMVRCGNPAENIQYQGLEIGDKVEAFGLRSGNRLLLCWSTLYYLRQTGTTNPPVSHELGDMMARINAEVGLNVRSCPSVDCAKITRVDYQTDWAIVGRTADSSWILLTIGEDQGWASADWLIINNDMASIPVVESEAMQLLNTLKKIVGWLIVITSAFN